MNKVRVLIVDDSALVRKLLTNVLGSSKLIEVVGSAKDAFDARNKIKDLMPDVITLDIEMPKMNGITFLKNLMRLRPMPVIMISSLTEQGADVTLEALECGAIDFVCKPKMDMQEGLNDYADEIIEKVMVASRSKVREKTFQNSRIVPKLGVDSVLPKKTKEVKYTKTRKIIAIGASTGGTEAISEILREMHVDSPAILITQHIPKAFSGTFARRMDKLSPMTVHEAEEGQKVLQGNVYIAPGDKHLFIERLGTEYFCKLNDGVPVNRHKPSVDVMFRSVAENAGPNSIGVLLTGMGNDGAVGLKEMFDKGAATLVQDENTSIVWGMPGSAVKLGATDKQVPLEKISRELILFGNKNYYE